MKKILTILIVLVITSSYGQNIKKANSLFEKNSLVKAAEAYKEIIEKDKSVSKEVLSNAALANYEVGNYRTAASIYSKMMGQNYPLSDLEIFNYVWTLLNIDSIFQICLSNILTVVMKIITIQVLKNSQTYLKRHTTIKQDLFISLEVMSALK